MFGCCNDDQKDTVHDRVASQPGKTRLKESQPEPQEDTLSLDTVDHSYFNLNSAQQSLLKSKGIYDFKSPNGTKAGVANKIQRGQDSDSRYIGQVSDGVLNGKVHYQQSNQGSGDFFICNFVDGRASGEGAGYYANGDYFIGTFKDNCRTKGVLALENGNVYTGQFVQNQFHGNGTLRNKDGRYYEGEWENGLREGQGFFKWTDGSTYKGEFKRNLQNGHGEHVDAKGIKTTGVFVDGVYKKSAQVSTSRHDV